MSFVTCLLYEITETGIMFFEKKKEGITFGTLVFHKQNNNINLKTYYQWH
jgi:hypothetical protein